MRVRTETEIGKREREREIIEKSENCCIKYSFGGKLESKKFYSSFSEIGQPRPNYYL